ncbi:MAG TPA: hypothetical protein VI320_05035 [Terracidiphilus sp.]|jgi:hypothetical protein
MALSDVLASIDGEIAQLRKARALLTGATLRATKRKPGRPRKIVTGISVPAAEPEKGKKRTLSLSLEGRRLISEAAKRRWAAERKAAS